MIEWCLISGIFINYVMGDLSKALTIEDDVKTSKTEKSTETFSSNNQKYTKIAQINRSSDQVPYTLGAGDRIQVEFFNVPEYNKEYQVLVDGSINLLLVGQVQAQNLTINQLTDLITKEYSRLVTEPIVTVTLAGIRPLNIAVAGEISRPGVYTMTPPSSTGGIQFPNLIDALELAKGVTAAADIRNVQIRRPRPQRPEEIININLWEFLQTGRLPQDITLRDGDQIFIPTAETFDSQEVRQRAKANFSADITQPITVVIIGEVNRPGPYTVFAADVQATGRSEELGSVTVGSGETTLVGLPTVTRAIKIAGGITSEANIREIQIRRVVRTGQEKIMTVNLWRLLQTGNINEDVLLQEGDSIIIPKAEKIDLSEAPEIAAASFSPNTITVNVVGEVVRPGIVTVPLNTSLNEALLTAGSFNRQRAKKATVELIRANQNGTVTRRTLEVDLSQSLNQENNPPLQNNDVIIVDRNGITKIAETFSVAFQPVSSVVQLIGLINSLIPNDNNNN
ncbi:MAG: polysaccharide biosynthesis/export family protein [Microcoleaceae cyanobacterium MO_207.B10]|nr:polysaccharide biosynthesis/export family protein [Microcoleaceae cyanobacterium MO_207.B10]